jgi:hypothetical protein
VKGPRLLLARAYQQPPVSVDEVARALGVTAIEYEQWEQGNPPIPFGDDRRDALTQVYGWDRAARSAAAKTIGRALVKRGLGQVYADYVFGRGPAPDLPQHADQPGDGEPGDQPAPNLSPTEE